MESGTSLIVALLIQGINFGLSILVRSLINKVGYDTDSERLSVIMVIFFITAFVNTAIIPLLTSANFKFTPGLEWLPINQQYSDLSHEWYAKVGPQIVMTVLIAAFMPYIDIMI